MSDIDLDAIRVTAERVQRFLADLEQDPSPANRERWRGAMADLRLSIRHARAEGLQAAEIQEATAGIENGRFRRVVATEAPAPVTDPVE